MRALMILVLFCNCYLLTAQVDKGQVVPVQSMAPIQQYVSLAEKFESLAKQGSFQDFYFNAACYWNLADEKEKAIHCLELAAANGFRYVDWYINEDDLLSLHRHRNWRIILKIIKLNQATYELEYGQKRSALELKDSSLLETSNMIVEKEYPAINNSVKPQH